MIGPKKAKSSTALLLIDVINELNFPGAESLAAFARPMAKQVRRLAERARRAGVPVIYVNDNFGRWKSDFRQTLLRCRRPKCRGRFLAELLAPAPEDYFVLKPMNSGFFQTPLELLLQGLEVSTLVLCGLATANCVYFTAIDAHMRNYRLIVPRDGTASFSATEQRFILGQMRKYFQVKITEAAKLRFPISSGRKKKKRKSLL